MLQTGENKSENKRTDWIFRSWHDTSLLDSLEVIWSGGHEPETEWGTRRLWINTDNLFGQKKQHPQSSCLNKTQLHAHFSWGNIEQRHSFTGRGKKPSCCKPTQLFWLCCAIPLSESIFKKSTEVWLNVDSEGGSDRGQQKGGRGFKGISAFGIVCATGRKKSEKGQRRVKRYSSSSSRAGTRWSWGCRGGCLT